MFEWLFHFKFSLFVIRVSVKMAIVKKRTVQTSKKNVFFKAASLTWDQFSSTTTIHGLKHINDPRGTKISK